MNNSLEQLILSALERRQDLRDRLMHEGTDAYRIFHGINEGMPGLSIDNYGTCVIVQTFRTALSKENRDLIETILIKHLPNTSYILFRHRENRRANTLTGNNGFPSEPHFCRERGLQFRSIDPERGLDPLLFLDIRSGRRYLSEICRNKRVLNLFSYTCSAGIVAAAGGAERVVNVDFSDTWLDIGRENATKNLKPEASIDFQKEDVLSLIRQYSGLGIKGKAARKSYRKYPESRFDIVFLDPPTFTKSRFGSVDINHDYQSLFKPSALLLHPNGKLFCTHHSAKISMSEWKQILTRCSEKIGRPIKQMTEIEPDKDFPSSDGRHPLKMLCITF